MKRRGVYIEVDCEQVCVGGVHDRVPLHFRAFKGQI